MQIRLLLFLLLLATVNACDSGGSDPDRTEEPPLPVVTYGVSVELIGKNYEGFVRIWMQDADTAEVYEEIEATENGTLQFSTRVAAGADVDIYAAADGGYLNDQDGRPRQSCGGAPVPLRDIAADAEARVYCDNLYHVFGTVEGLRGTRAVSDDRLLLGTNAGEYDIDRSRPFDFGPYRSSENWSLEIRRQPGNPDQECRIQGDRAGTVAGADVSGVRVLCDLRTIGGTVTGLRGSGLTLNLSAQLEEDQGIVFDIEQLEIESDGAFQFETSVVEGGEYEVTVVNNPSDPEQECSVARGVGIAFEEVNDVFVSCPNPWRVWWFHDSESQETTTPEDRIGEPLGGVREQDAGPVYEEYVYPEENSVALGPMLGLQDQLPFNTVLDAPAKQAVVSSNTDGKKFWLAAESGRVGGGQVVHVLEVSQG